MNPHRLQARVRKPLRPHIVGAPYLKPYQIDGVVDHSHSISLRIPDADDGLVHQRYSVRVFGGSVRLREGLVKDTRGYNVFDDQTSRRRIRQRCPTNGSSYSRNATPPCAIPSAAKGRVSP